MFLDNVGALLRQMMLKYDPGPSGDVNMVARIAKFNEATETCFADKMRW